MLLVGPIPVGLFILHSCDNRGCVNPAHLRPGTHDDNMLDKMTRGRQNHKLSLEAVKAIRADNRTHKEIAETHGVSQSTVTMIKQRKRWAWVPDE